ncbi:unnamed protein product, partial [Urochloa humidicola]
ETDLTVATGISHLSLALSLHPSGTLDSPRPPQPCSPWFVEAAAVGVIAPSRRLAGEASRAAYLLRCAAARHGAQRGGLVTEVTDALFWRLRRASPGEPKPPLGYFHTTKTLALSNRWSGDLICSGKAPYSAPHAPPVVYQP